MIRFSVKRPIAITMLIGILVVLGFVSFTKLGLDLFPELSYPSVTIVTSYPGVSPEDIEELITKPIEEAVSTINGVKKVTSSSFEGISVVTVEFSWDKNLDFAAQDVRDKVGMIEGYLPEDASKPLVMKYDVSSMPIMELYVYSDNLSAVQVRKFIDKQIKNRLERIDGVASVVAFGGRVREIWIQADPKRLAEYNISMMQIVNILRSHNLNMPTGRLVQGQKEYLIRGMGEFENIDEIKNIIVGSTPGGTPVYLRDVAQVIDTYKEKRGYFRVNDRPTAFMDIMKQSGTNTVVVADRVKKEIEKIQRDYPEIKIKLAFDQSKLIRRVINRTSNNAIVGALLAALMILFFLRNIRPTIIISLAIPLSVIITFIIIYFAHYTLNLMTMGGIALGVGLLVDNAVVVIENIFRHLENGEDKFTSAIDGTSEVVSAITASTFTNIIVFFPLIYIGELVGKLTKQLAVTVSSTLLASLFVAITIIPMLSRVFLKERRKEEYSKAYGSSWFEPFRNFYKRGLSWVLKHRILTVFTILVVFIGSLALIPRLGIEFMPQMNREFAMIHVSLPTGTKLEETNNYVKVIEAEARKLPDVKLVASIVGETEGSEMMASFLGEKGVNTAIVFLSFVPLKERKLPSYENVELLLDRIPKYKGAKVTAVDFTRMMFSGGSSKPIQIKIYGQDLEAMRDVANRIMKIVEDVPGAVRPELSIIQAKPEIRINIDNTKAMTYGLTPYQIEQEINTAMLGKVATKYRERGEEIDVRVIYRPNSKDDIEKLLSLPLQTAMGTVVPLKEIAHITYAFGPVKIDREKQSRMIAVLADVKGRSVGQVSMDIEKELRKISLPHGLSISMGGEFEQIKEMIKDMLFAMVAAALLIYMVMAAQFESFKDPFIIMFTLPLAIIGVILLLYFTHTTVSVSSLMGTLILSGIAVNNAIVMIDFIRQLIAKGMDRFEAVVEGASIRLRPILITALTTIIGMLPMAVSHSEGSEMRAPMAIAVIGGLLTTTFLTLFVIPVVFTIFERIRHPERVKK